MKIIIISIIITLFTTDLLSRENPFVATQTFIEKKKQIESKILQELQDEDMIVDMDDNITEDIADDMVEEEVVVKKEDPIYYDILPFIKVSTLSNKLIIDIEDKYKLINQDINHEERKFVFDFRGRLNIYTKRVFLNHNYFKSIIVGSHKKDNFFRVVVVLNDEISSYEDNLDIDNSIITITKLK